MQLSNVSLAVRSQQQPAPCQAQNNNLNPAPHTDAKKDAFQKTSTQKAPQFGCFERLWKRSSRKVQDVNAKDAIGQTAIAKAIQTGLDRDSAREIKKLIAQGANVSITDNNGDFPLLTAARLNRFECVSALLSASNIDVNQRNQHNDTAIRVAARHGSVDVVELLLGKGANHTIANNSKSSPLSAAERTLAEAQQLGDTSLAEKSARIIALLTQAAPPTRSATDESKRPDPNLLRSI